MNLTGISYNAKSSRIPTLGFGNNQGFFAWWSSAEGCLVRCSKLNHPSIPLDVQRMPRTFSIAVDSCRHQAARWWWGGGRESLALPLSPAEALWSQPQYGAYPDLPPHVTEPGLLVSSNLLLQIISSLLLLLLFLVPHSSFCNNEMIWKKGGLVCQPAMLTGMKCRLSPLHTSPYTFTRESFPSDVFVFFSCLSIISDTAPWMSENYKC